VYGLFRLFCTALMLAYFFALCFQMFPIPSVNTGDNLFEKLQMQFDLLGPADDDYASGSCLDGPL